MSNNLPNQNTVLPTGSAPNADVTAATRTPKDADSIAEPQTMDDGQPRRGTSNNDLTVSPSTRGTTAQTQTASSPANTALQGPKGQNTQKASNPPSTTNTHLLSPSSTPITSSAAPAASNASAASNSADVSKTSDSSGYSSGALAGAIVGSIIGAALLTFLAAWLFFRKRNQKDRFHSQHGGVKRLPSGPRSNAAVGGAIAEKASSSTSGESAFGWHAYLPQSADDQTVKSRVKTLFDQIELHVDNYYTKANVRVDAATHAALARLDDGYLPGSVENLIANPNTTLPVIKHCIASLLIDRMTPGSGSGASLLPAYLATQPRKLQSSSLPSGEQHAVHQALSQWRQLNAYLFPQPQEDREYQANREKAAKQLDQQISAAFAAWQAAEGLKQHQKSLFDRAGEVGVLIMSQSSAYEFVWSLAQDPSRSLVVFPGLAKTTDERGRPLDQPQTLLRPVASR